MNIETNTASLLAALPPVWRSGMDTHVPTHCLYLGGGQVVVVVRQGHDGLLVTDDRLGWTTLLSAGVEPARKAAQMAGRQTAERMGVQFERGVFLLDGVAVNETASAILHVANASQAWVTEVLLGASQRQERDLRHRAEAVVTNLFGRERVRFHERIAGASTKTHDISILITLPDDRCAIVEPVTNHPNAIAATYLKFSDIGRAHADWPREAMVDEVGAWRSEDIVLLAEVGTGVSDVAADPANLRRLAMAA